MNKNIISRTLTSLFACAMTGAVLIPAFAVNADTKIKIDEKNFPDENFREVIRHGDVGKFYDDDNDGYLSSDEIKRIEYVYCEKCGIDDLTGIELLTNLEILYCGDNKLTKIDLSKNTKLKELYIDNNKLDKLDLSKNTKLHTLYCDNNPLKTLDLSNNTNLKDLSCGENPFETLDLSKNTKLKDLRLNKSKLKTLDLSNNKDLVKLNLLENNFEKLDLSKNTKLKEIYINGNKIKKVDLPYSTDLVYLDCSDNYITSLDLERCPNLDFLVCSNNEITSLDLERCPKLGVLVCSENSITSLDLEPCPELQIVRCSNCAIKSLNFKSCPKLRELDCSNNKLSSLDLKSCPNLEYLTCSNNAITSLNIEPNNKLYKVDCNNNKLTSLDISANTNLFVLSCQGNQIDKLDISRCYCLLEAFEGEKSMKDGYVYYTKDSNKLCVDDKTTVISCLTIDDNTKHVFLDQDEEVPLGFEGADDQTNVTMISSDYSIVRFENNTLVTGKAGSADITANVGDKEYKFKVTVYYKDVKDNTKFWFEPTYALTDKGVVKGYDNQTKFKPGNKCTRAQMVTFIWRLAGSPEPETKECKFSDVKKSDYFYKACLWGNEKGIVEGYKDGTFGPQIVCARRHAVTFLWRLAGKPEPAGDKTKFTDVFKDIDENDYFFKATIWATEKKVVAGYEDNTFRPDGDCLRRQMVTFLYKYDKFVNAKK